MLEPGSRTSSWRKGAGTAPSRRGWAGRRSRQWLERARRPGGLQGRRPRIPGLLPRRSRGLVAAAARRAVRRSGPPGRTQHLPHPRRQRSAGHRDREATARLTATRRPSSGGSSSATRRDRSRSTIAAGRRREIAADYFVCALPACTARDVFFDPALPEPQHDAIAHLRYGCATRLLLQFDRRFWKKPGRPIAFGSDLPTGAVWDGNEQQRGARHPELSRRRQTPPARCRTSSRRRGGRRHPAHRVAGQAATLLASPHGVGR